MYATYNNKYVSVKNGPAWEVSDIWSIMMSVQYDVSVTSQPYLAWPLLMDVMLICFHLSGQFVCNSRFVFYYKQHPTKHGIKEWHWTRRRFVQTVRHLHKESNVHTGRHRHTQWYTCNIYEYTETKVYICFTNSNYICTYTYIIQYCISNYIYSTV